VPYADLRLGSAVRPVLEAHLQAGAGRVRGIRQGLAWDSDPTLVNAAYGVTEDMSESDAFRAGFAQLAELGLSFDAWLLFHQIPRLTALARAFPQVPIVLNHCGGVLGSGRFHRRRDGVYPQWRSALRELATQQNVMVKLSGLGMRLSGFGFEALAQAPSSADLAAAWRPWMETCLESFGAARCMFGSNFPVDKGSYGYGVGLNAVQRILAGASAEEQADVLGRTAARFYCIPLA
jgi:L-fuconolactonase